MRNKIEGLWSRLLAIIEGLLDEDKSLDTERAKVMVHVGSVIIESAKVEVRALEIIGSPNGSGSTFLQISRKGPK